MATTLAARSVPDQPLPRSQSPLFECTRPLACGPLLSIRGATVRTLLTIAFAAVIIIGAIALGLKFFNTSVSEQEDGEDE